MAGEKVEENSSSFSIPEGSILANFSKVGKRLDEIYSKFDEKRREKPKVLVLGAVSGLGHIIEGISVAQHLSKIGYEAEFRNFSDKDVAGGLVRGLWEGLVARTYEFLQRKGFVNRANSGNGPIEKLHSLAAKRLSRQLYEYVISNGYDIVITTHPTPAEALWHARENAKKDRDSKPMAGDVKRPYIINWIPDIVPPEIAWFYAVPADETWVVDEKSANIVGERMQEENITENIRVMGHPGPPTLYYTPGWVVKVGEGENSQNLEEFLGNKRLWMARTGGAGTNYEDMKTVLDYAMKEGEDLIVLVNHHEKMAMDFDKYLESKGLKDEEYQIYAENIPGVSAYLTTHDTHEIGRIRKYSYYTNDGKEGNVYVVYATGNGINKRANAALLNIILLPYAKRLFTKPGEQALYEAWPNDETGNPLEQQPWMYFFPPTNPQEEAMKVYAIDGYAKEATALGIIAKRKQFKHPCKP